ncbi:MAG: extracellular solute-binding protein [Firmicutes bacterium]|jgi:ABC-type glycerol-3-phosphate transport system substrate-binding protein|nr:extracellular solute-binding protein [Bacillota bacterium]NLL87917.1 extracellular solute-binding protein [Bacillota bacterium]
MKRISVMLIAIVCVVVLAAGFACAEYELPPGVKSPDEVDFGGKMVTIIRGALPDLVHDPNRVDRAKELFNVEFNEIRLESADQIIARIMAGDSKYDIIRTPHREGYFALVSAGMLLPADDYLPDEFFEWLPPADRYTIEKLKYQGQRYGIGVHEDVFNESIMIMSYNRDLIEKYGLPDPWELYLAGEWTYDKLEELATVITEDTDGDGVIDQRGIDDVAGRDAFIRFAHSNGAETAVQEYGKWVFAYNRENAIEAFNTIIRWREKGIMGSGSYDAGKVGFKIHTHLAGNRHAQAAGVNFGFVPMPRGPHAERHYYPTFAFWMMTLPTNAEAPEDLIALANYLYRPGDRQQKLDEQIDLYMTDQQHFRMYMEAIDSWQGEGDPFQSTDIWTVLSTPVSDVLGGRKGAAAAMDEIAPQVQALLDDLFKQ